MEPYEPLLAIATAIAVGLLVGMEREQTHPDDPSLFAGVRTYPIIALIGAVATLLDPGAPWLPLAALAGVTVLVAMSYAHSLRNGQHGATTEARLILVDTSVWVDYVPRRLTIGALARPNDTSTFFTCRDPAAPMPAMYLR